MRVKNLPTILREYAILWVLGTLFGVTQDVDMVTTRASSFGRFAVAVLEPEAIPTKLDVIIGNRYFQLIFEVEPFFYQILGCGAFGTLRITAVKIMAMVQRRTLR